MIGRRGLQLSDNGWVQFREACELYFKDRVDLASYHLYEAGKLCYHEGLHAYAVSLVKHCRILAPENAEYAGTLGQLEQQGHQVDPELTRRLSEYFQPPGEWYFARPGLEIGCLHRPSGN